MAEIHTGIFNDWYLDPPKYTNNAYGNPIYSPPNPTHPSWQKLTNWNDLGRNGEYLRSTQTKWAYIHPSNGKLWHLAGPMRGREGVVLGKELEGAMHADFEIKYSEGPYLIGAQAERVDWKKRVINLGVVIQPNLNAERKEESGPFNYRLIEDSWWSSWSATQPGFLGSFTRSHGWRWIKVTLGEASKTAVSIDPASDLGGSLMQWNMTLHAPWPFYSKRSLSTTWKASLANLRNDVHEGVIKCANRGTWESHPKFLITGHGDVTVQDGTGGPIIKLPRFYSSDGDFMMIDTDPTKRTVVTQNDPVDDALYKYLRNSQLLDVLLHDVTAAKLPAQRRIPGGIGFNNKIEPRTVANLKVTHSNQRGTVTCIMPQSYQMAWS